MPECERIRPLLPLLLLGDAAPSEQAATEAHLAVCAACRAERERVARVVDEVRRDLCAVPIPEPLPPDLWWRSHLPDAGLAEQEEALPAVWRGVTVALQTMDVPEQLSSDRIEAIFKRVESQSEPRRGFRLMRPLAAIAAAAAVLLAGAGIWYGARHSSVFSASRSPSPEPEDVATAASPVTVVEWKGAWGLELPQKLPGRVRVAKGQVKVRLPSGVELSLLGPLEMEAAEDGMEVRLKTGRLMAWVPPRASGFTVRAPGLTAWDIGTIFSVAADMARSSLFVFKGSVQVLDEKGDGIDICGAGEGVVSVQGGQAVKFAADWPQAYALFKEVAGWRATEAPVRALAAAERIGELWVARYVPEEAAKVRQKAQREAVLRNAPQKVPFSQAAWVRPAVARALQGTAKPVLSAKEENMKTRSAAAILTAAVVTMGAQPAGAASEPSPLFVAPQLNRGWSTLFTNEVSLAWNWNTSAARAQLDIVGMNGSVSTNFAEVTTNWLWRAFESAVPTAEDAYTLTLTFYGASENVVEAQTSRLAVVKGVFGEALLDPGPSDRIWTRVRENAVLPYDAGWAEATAEASAGQLVIVKSNGTVQTNALDEANGFFGWKVRRSDWGYGTFNLALSFPETVTNTWNAAVVRVPEGMMIKVQ